MAKGTVGSGERKRLVARWRRSGQSAAAFADRHGISQWALYWWARQGGAGAKGRRPPQRSVQRSTTAGAPGFIPVRLVGEEHSDPPAPAEGIVEIRLRGGDVVRVVGEVSVERLRVVVAAVRQAC
jgi:hypothetical protein